MKAIQKAIKEKKMDPKTDREIIDEVLKSHNRGHIAGVGRVVPGTGSSSRSSQVDEGLCTREELEEIKKKHAMEMHEQRKAFENRDNLFKQFLDFYNRQQGTPASQFQIPDSYTPMFPGSTYTRGGPSTTHSDPSSNIDLDNCYKPINVDEDDDGRDGNSGHTNEDKDDDDGYGSEFDDGNGSEFDDYEQ